MRIRGVLCTLLAVCVITPVGARAERSRLQPFAHADVFRPVVLAAAAPTPAGTTPVPGPESDGPAGDGITIPSDGSGAVGVHQIMTATNTGVTVRNRAGVVQVQTTLHDWWNGLGATAPFGPQVLFDPYAKRWIFTAAADPTSPTSSVLVAISDSPDPTGSWHRYQLLAAPSTLRFTDAPAVGFNNMWIVVQANVYDATGSFQLSRLFVFGRDDFYRHTLWAAYVKDLVGLGGFHQPAVTYDMGLGSLYMLQATNGGLELFEMTGTLDTQTITDDGSVAAPQAFAFTGPGAPQAGTSTTIDLGDARLGRVTYRNGSLWAAHGVFLPANAPTHAAVQWWQVSPQRTVQQFGRIENSTGSYGYPSIAVNSGGDALIGFTRFSATTYPSSAYAYRNGADPAGFTQPPVAFHAGVASYVNKDAFGVNRWGAYSTTGVDGFNDRDFWTVQPFASSPVGPLGRWGTWWTRVAPTVAATIGFDRPSLPFGSQTLGTTSASQTIDLTNVGNIDLSIGQVLLSGAQAADYAITADSCSGHVVIEADDCRVSVRFTPGAEGSRPAALVVPSNAPTSPDLVPITGTGTKYLVAPRTSLDPTSISFGSVQVGSSSGAVPVRVSNIGNANLFTSQATVGGQSPGDFTIVTDSCTGASVPPGASCALSVRFSPSALGTRLAEVTMFSNVPGGFSKFNVFGDGADLVPPSSSFETSDYSVHSSLPLPQLVTLATVDGVTTDDLSGVRGVMVSFSSPALSTIVHAALACTPNRLRCAWSVEVPMTPGVYAVTAQGTDLAGNLEPNPPRITIIVI